MGSSRASWSAGASWNVTGGLVVLSWRMPDPWFLFVSFMAAVLGLALFRYGRRQSRLPHLIGGIGLMAVPWALPSALWVAVVSVLLCGLVFALVRLGL